MHVYGTYINMYKKHTSYLYQINNVNLIKDSKKDSRINTLLDFLCMSKLDINKTVVSLDIIDIKGTELKVNIINLSNVYALFSFLLFNFSLI